MRVLMVGWEFPPHISGGLGTHCYHLVKSLSGKVDLTLLVPNKGKDIPGVDIVEMGTALIDPYYGTGNRKENKWKGLDPVNKYHARCVQFSKRLHQEKGFDVVHCHDWLTVGAGIEIKKRTGKPLVFMVHSTEHDRGAGLGVNEYILNREQAGIDHADVVITNSNRMKEQLIDKFRAPEEKIRVVYNAVNTDRFEGIEREKLKGNKIVLYLSRLALQKGPKFFLEAAEKVLDVDPEVTFVVGGKGHLMPELIDFTLKRDLTRNIVFTGYVSEEKLPLLYGMSDVYVLPSVSEPFGISALEAMASGTPTIISKECGVSEVINHCLKVDFWDTDQMAEKIISVLRYAPLKRELSRNGKLESQKFDWDQVARENLQVYRGVVQ